MHMQLPAFKWMKNPTPVVDDETYENHSRMM